MLVRNANPPMAAGTVPPCLFDPQLNPVCAEYDKYWEDVAVKYSPQFKFHPKETIWPITIDEYLTHVTGCVGSTFETGWEDQITYNQPVPVTPTNLDTLLSDGALKTEQGYTALVCAGEVDEETDWVKDSGRNPANGGTKVYTIIYDPKPDDKDSFVEIQYWMFNPYNYVFYDSLAGIYNHVTDLVAIAIRFTKTGQPQRIWYAQHGDGPVWAWDTGADWADSRAKNFATVLGTHPIVYVSQENHEHYPKAGDNFNCHMGVCDNTGNGGTTWAPFDSPQSAFEFVHVKSEMSATMPNADRAKLFQGRNKWMAFNGKIGGYVKGTHLHTGINSISFQKNQGKERQRLVQARRIEVMRQQSHVAGLEGRIQEGKEERERTRTALAGTMVTAALAGTSAHHA
ncbi:hypothetical protein CLOP_g11463 [Closterium sp. NIES-67]|nr:hypothetical protein CLOP_g11463 [Closterium sp. NIES-67]